MEALAKLFELLKLPIKYVIGACAVSALVVFSPASFLASLGLLEYREKGKPYFGALLLILIAIIIAAIVGAAAEKRNDYLLSRARHKRLHLLTAEEMKILRGYIEGKTRTQSLPINCGITLGLIRDGVIVRLSEYSTPGLGMAFDHNIQPWAWDYLNEHRELLR